MHLIGVLGAPSGPLSFLVVLSRPLTTPFALGADGILVVVVLLRLVALAPEASRARGVREAPREDLRWWRTAAFLGGAVLLFAAVGSGLARYEGRPSVLVVQHVLLMMAAPPLLVVGRSRRACRAPDPRVPDVPSRPARVLRILQGVTSWPLYYGSMAAFFLTPVLGDSVRDPVLLDLVDCWFVAVGLLFFSGFTGRARTGTERTYGFRIAALLAGAPLETAVGLALVLWPRPLIAGTALTETHTAGLVLWIASMAASGAVLGAILVRWVLDDSRRGAEIDLLLDARPGTGVTPATTTVSTAIAAATGGGDGAGFGERVSTADFRAVR